MTNIAPRVPVDRNWRVAARRWRIGKARCHATTAHDDSVRMFALFEAAVLAMFGTPGKQTPQYTKIRGRVVYDTGRLFVPHTESLMVGTTHLSINRRGEFAGLVDGHERARIKLVSPDEDPLWSGSTVIDPDGKAVDLEISAQVIHDLTVAARPRNRSTRRR